MEAITSWTFVTFMLAIWFRLYFSLLFLQLEVFQMLGYAASSCDHSEISSTFLDLAVEFISKAKLNFPVCPTLPQNKVSRPVDCEEVLRRCHNESKFCRIGDAQNSTLKPIDCEEVFFSGHNKSGVYTIWPRNRIMGNRSLDVFCDMDTDGGGWTVIQRRGNFDTPVDYFFKDWLSYKQGFGDIKRDFWLGNDNLYVLSNQRLSSIRFDLQAVDGEKGHAHYDDFWIEDESNRYRLHIDGYSGDSGDSIAAYHNNHKFSAKDQDNDNSTENCATKYKGAWWYNGCHYSNLNGMYYRGKHENAGTGVNWHAFKGNTESLETTEMKIRSKDFSLRKSKSMNIHLQ